MSRSAPRGHGARSRGSPTPPPVDQTREANALKAARRGDLRAWEWLIRRHQELVYRSAYLTTRDSELAVAATAGAFMRAYRSLASLETDAPVRPWLMGIADTVARSQLRESAQRRDERVPEPEPWPRVAPTLVRLPPELPTRDLPEPELLLDAVDGLTDPDRATLAARYAFALGRDEAAARLGVDHDEVDERLRLSMTRLRGRVAEAMARTTATDADGRSRAYWEALDRLEPLSDDQLGSLALAAVIAGLPWTPDVAAGVCDRLAREANAYPEAGTVASDAAPRRTRASESTVESRGMGAPSTRPAVWVLRGMGVLAAVSLFVVAFAAAGGMRAPDADLGDDVRSAIAGFIDDALGTPPVAEASPAPDVDAPLPAGRGTIGGPVVEASPAVETIAWRPEVSIVGARWRDDGVPTAVVLVERSPTDARSAGGRARLEQQIGAGEWQTSASTAAPAPLLAEVAPGLSYRFRVHRVDAAGNEDVSEVAHVELVVRGPRSGRLALSEDDWAERRSTSGWRRLIATEAGATARTAFFGSDVAIIGPVGRGREAISVRIDEGTWVSDPDAFGRSRPVLFADDLVEGRHSLEVRAEAEGLAIDAILILRSPGA